MSPREAAIQAAHAQYDAVIRAASVGLRYAIERATKDYDEVTRLALDQRDEELDRIDRDHPQEDR